jgi:tetratricopeptide (TPR) repeat protein
LADFGLARIAEAGASTLSGDMLMGTPQYISPEQASGVKNLDERTDIYSFGIILYEMMVGRVPFNADTPFSIIHDHIYTPLPLPRDVNPNISPEIQRVLLKALAKNPKDRYSTAEEMVKAYLGALRSEADLIGAQDAPAKEMTKVSKKVIPAAREISEQAQEARSSRQLKFDRRWLWIITGLMITCMSLVMIAAVANRPGIRTLFGNSQSEINSTQEIQQGEVPEIIMEAQMAVRERPDDLEAHRKLGDAYLEEGKLPQALDEYKRAVGLAFEQDRRLEGVEILSDMVKLQGGPLQADRGWVDDLTEALFNNVHAEEFQAMDEIITKKFPDWVVIPILEARRLLLNGEYAESKRILDKVLEGSPDNVLAQAVSAELKFKTGENRDALASINSLLNDSRLPSWLRLHLANLQQEIKNTSEK